MSNRALFYCSYCKDKRWFELEGNVKICDICHKKSSYKEVARKRWVYAKSHPDSVSASPYNQPAADNVKDQFDDIQSRFYLLSSREREVIELLWEGKTEKEAAAILNITQQRVSACLRRARQKLVVVEKPD